MVEQAFVIVQTEQQGADKRLLFQVAKSANHAIRGSLLFDLLHTGALARLIGKVHAFGHNPVQADAHTKPLACNGDVVRGR